MRSRSNDGGCFSGFVANTLSVDFHREIPGRVLRMDFIQRMRCIPRRGAIAVTSFFKEQKCPYLRCAEIDFDGGRSRARTLDPLIKRPIFSKRNQLLWRTKSV